MTGISFGGKFKIAKCKNETENTHTLTRREQTVGLYKCVSLHKERAFQEVSSSHLRQRTPGQQEDSRVLNPLKKTPVTIHLQGFRGEGVWGAVCKIVSNARIK